MGSSASPTWPEMKPSDAAGHGPMTSGPTSTATATWVEPVDGACPDGYPIKANATSGIYHVPGGRFYERTIPERCYVSPEAAAADGYRAAKA